MHTLAHSVPLNLKETATNPCLYQRLLDTHRQIWVSLLWGHCSFLLMCTGFCLCSPRVCSPSLMWVLSSNPNGLQSQILWEFSISLPDPKVGKSVVGPKTFLIVQEFLWYNCSAVCGSSVHLLFGGINGDLLQEGLRHRLCDPGSCTQSPCLCGRPMLTHMSIGDSNTGLAQSLWGLWVLVGTKVCLSYPSVSGGYGVWF